MLPWRHILVRALQRASVRISPSHVEAVSQASYLDLARRTDWLRDPPLASAVGGTASFSLLYLLLCILRDGQPTRILELGVGTSTGLIDAYGRTAGADRFHIDDDAGWLGRMVPGGEGVTAVHAPLQSSFQQGRKIRWYGCRRPSGAFDLVLVDGPQAWSSSDRYNRLGALSWLPEILDREFAVIVDDASRPGERTLVSELERRLKVDGHQIATATFTGRTTQTLLASQGFSRFAYL